jgi:hypothetical protein
MGVDLSQDLLGAGCEQSFRQGVSHLLGRAGVPATNLLHHAPSVQTGDHPCELQRLSFDLAECGDRGDAASAEASKERPLRRCRQSRLAIIELIDKCGDALVVLPDFDCKGALADRRQAQFRLEAFCHPLLQAKTDEAGSSQHDGVQAERLEFPEAGLDIAAERDDLQVGAAMQKLNLSPEAAGPYSRPGGKLSELKAIPGNERVQRVFADHDGAQTEAGR